MYGSTLFPVSLQLKKSSGIRGRPCKHRAARGDREDPRAPRAHGAVAAESARAAARGAGAAGLAKQGLSAAGSGSPSPWRPFHESTGPGRWF